MTAINDKYNALGGSPGFLGAPTSGEILNTDGVGYHQDFANGAIHWHPDLGAYEVHGAIRARWAALGNETSAVGYPLTDENPSLHIHSGANALGFPARNQLNMTTSNQSVR